MIIRDILETELEELIALYADYTAKENLPPLSKKRIQKIWREVERNPGVHYFVLENENRIAAACILSPPRIRPCADDVPSGIRLGQRLHRSHAAVGQ